jgi:integrase
MANLGKKNGVFLARFRYRAKEYKRSLRTSDRKAAEAALHRVEDVLHRLTIHVITVPADVDPGDFILSGGVLATPAVATDRPARTTVQAVAEYLDSLGHLAQSNRATMRSHLRNLIRLLGAKAERPLGQIEPRDLEDFLQVRLQERCHTTVGKDRHTVVQFFAWATARGYLAASPASGLPKIKASGDASAFRTVQEIEASLQRGGLDANEIFSAWDRLYLAPPEIAALLSTVKERALDEVSYLLHAIPAYTGMRRGEVLRLRWLDVELDQDALVARSHKQSRQAVETRRRIDLHPELKKVLLEWKQKRPRGQFVICDADGVGPLTTWRADTLFRQPLRRTTWCLSSSKDWFKIGFHTYRHSFASNLAAAGVDQRVIDEFMGHTTEAMRRRYRHLFPKNRRAAIQSFSLENGALAAGAAATSPSAERAPVAKEGGVSS